MISGYPSDGNMASKNMYNFSKHIKAVTIEYRYGKKRNEKIFISFDYVSRCWVLR